MKKIVSSILGFALLLGAGMAYAGLVEVPQSRLSTNSSVLRGTLGDIRHGDNSVYKLVQAGSAVVKGVPVVAETSSGNRVVAVSAVSTLKGVAVVGIAQVDMDTGNYGWIQIGGVADVRSDTNVAVKGSKVKCGAVNTNSCNAALTSDTQIITIGVYLETDPDSATLDKVLLQGLY